MQRKAQARVSLIRKTSLLLGAFLFLFVGFARTAAAPGTSSYTSTKDTYSFSYPSTWTVKQAGTKTSLVPPASTIKTLKASGVSYAASSALLNNDSTIYTSSLKKALQASWKEFISAYAAAVAKKYGAKATAASYQKSGWKVKTVTLKKKAQGVTTWRRFVVMTKDQKKVYVIAETWTKNNNSPFAAEIRSLVKSLAVVSAKTVNWTFDGSTWRSDATPPSCANPLEIPSPVDVAKATSVLYPGQYRGGNYKPHGGFRFDTSAYNAITVTVPLDARVVSASRYLEGGSTQYLFDLYTSCGIRMRFDHLNTLSTVFQNIADQLPAAQEGNTQTTVLGKPVIVKAGDLVATAVGTPTNPFIDFGVYDLRARNNISSDSEWASEHADAKEMGWHAVCWLTLLPGGDAATVRGLPPADRSSGAASDYCTPDSLYQTYAAYAGTWTGSWSNTSFGSTGDMNGELTIEKNGTARLVLDVDGFVFGLADPVVKTFTGSYDEGALRLTGANDDVFGDLTMTFAQGGIVTVSGLEVPASDIDVLSASGTVTTSALNANYTLTFGGATFAQGTMSLTKN